MWLDKFCVQPENIPESLACLPCYIAGCHITLVLGGPSYLDRLWCVVEVSCGACSARAARQPPRCAERLAHAQRSSWLACSPLSAPFASQLFVFHEMGGTHNQLKVLLPPNVKLEYEAFDVLRAKCSSTADRKRLLSIIESGTGTFDRFNSRLRVIIGEAQANALQLQAEETARKQRLSLAQLPWASRALRLTASPSTDRKHEPMAGLAPAEGGGIARDERRSDGSRGTLGSFGNSSASGSRAFWERQRASSQWGDAPHTLSAEAGARGHTSLSELPRSFSARMAARMWPAKGRSCTRAASNSSASWSENTQPPFSTAISRSVLPPVLTRLSAHLNTQYEARNSLDSHALPSPTAADLESRAMARTARSVSGEALQVMPV